MVKDEANFKDETKVETGQASSEPTVKVKVLANSGIFKNGKQYEQGETAEISADAARKFEQLGEVEIVDGKDGDA